MDQGSAVDILDEPRNRDDLRTSSDFNVLSVNLKSSRKMVANGEVEVNGVQVNSHAPPGIRCLQSCSSDVSEEREGR